MTRRLASHARTSSIEYVITHRMQTAAEQARLDGLDASERVDAELRARSLVYVAATWARDELAVLQRSR